MPLVRLSPRKAYRAVLVDVRDRYVAALRAYGPEGASLWAQAAKAPIKLLRWGGKWALSTVGQKLTWFVRGTVHQKAHPINENVNAALAERLVTEEVAATLDGYDREAR